MKNVSDVIGAFLIGVAVGTVIGILYAPQSGEETRKLISEKSQKAKEEVSEQVEKLKEEFDKLKKQVSKVTSEITEKISQQFEKKVEAKNE